MKKLTGGCTCGFVKYQLKGEIKNLVNCHCTICRRMNGSAFSTYAAVFADDFEILQGEMKTYPVTDKARKSFCGECGTPIYNFNPIYPGLKILHYGSLDKAQELEPRVNIYCDSKLAWLENIWKIECKNEGLR